MLETKKEIIGTSNEILEINLTDQSFKVYKVAQEERRMFLGAKGLGLKLIYDRQKSGVDPFSPDNIIAFMMGVFMGTGAPCSGRFSAITKSPLTGAFFHSSCGGPFGMALKTAGWDGVLISGQAKMPTYLLITADGVVFKDAAELWGLNTLKAQEQLTKMETLGKDDGALVIGPAGENKVRFANICSGHRFVGRGGQGAVFGAKNLKAIVAKGGIYKIIPVKLAAFEKTKRTATKYINANNVTSNLYRNFGTSANLNFCNKAGILPVKNFTKGHADEAIAIAGETVREKHNTKHHTCRPCTILCGKKGVFDGKERVVSEYETVGLLGTNLEIFDPTIVAKWNELCGELGMDTISAGNVLGWVMEATEKGLVKSKLKFGSPDGIDAALTDMAYLKGLGKDMALGVRALAVKYGGEDFAIQVKGLEMPAYDPRGCVGQGLSYAVANRGGCHLSTAIFAMEAFFHLLKPNTVRAKAEFVKFFENMNSCINSLQTCQFTAFAYTLEVPLTKYTPKPLLGFIMQNLPEVAVNLVDFGTYTQLWSCITGIGISNGEFLKAGNRVHLLERFMNNREGIGKKDDTLPLRFLKEGRDCDPDKQTVPLEALLSRYYKVRGYDENGVPTKSVLAQHGIQIKE